MERLLDTPHAAQVIRRLQPEVLHRVILTSGLEDAGELVALASPAQLQRVFDFDLWRAPRPGLDERLDADRFAAWLEVLMDTGAEVAAEKLLGMDPDYIVAALAQHVRVFDGAAVAPYMTLDGELIAPKGPARQEFSAEIGGFFVVARRATAWDALVPLLQHLDAWHRDDFARLMRSCRDVSRGGFEKDGLHDLASDHEQQMFEVATDRTRRMEQQGYATPAQARAFLQAARHLDLAGAAAPPRSVIAAAYFHDIAEAAADAAVNAAAGDDPTVAPADPSADAEMSAAVSAVADLLADAGVVSPVRALLAAPAESEPARASWLQAFLRNESERSPDAVSMRLAELAFVTNTLAVGTSVQERPLTVREASDAAVAVCNLGLETWPAAWSSDRDLVTVFQVGWAVLHRDVGMHAAERLITVLGEVSIGDRDIQLGLHELRSSLIRHCRTGEPWRAQNALEVLAILDLPAWTALTALLSECPTLHQALDASLRSGVRTIDPKSFEFISEHAQIERIREFLRVLPERLTN